MIGLLESASLIKKINNLPLSEIEVENRLERLEILHKASTATDNAQFDDYLKDVILNNPRLIILLRTYFAISIMAYTALSSIKRGEYQLLQDIQRDILKWRKLFLNQIDLMEELL